MSNYLFPNGPSAKSDVMGVFALAALFIGYFVVFVMRDENNEAHSVEHGTIWNRNRRYDRFGAVVFLTGLAIFIIFAIFRLVTRR